MKRLSLLVFFFIFLVPFAYTQTTWSGEIAPVMYKKCLDCHHQGGIGIIDFDSYESVYNMRYVIQQVIQDGTMPPWLPDPEYRHFADEFYLTDSEKNLIIDWVNNGAPAGDLTQVPSPPIYSTDGSLMDTISYVAAIEPYTLQYNTDEYRWFVIPTNFPNTVYVNQIEVIPGVEASVHHADIYLDYSDASYNNDIADPLPGFNSSSGTPNLSRYINAWQPGAGIARYPENWGIPIEPGTDIVIEIHFGPGSVGEIDSTIMNLKFLTPNVNTRDIQVGWLLYDSAPVLQDGPLVTPANTVKTFHQKTLPFQNDVSLVSICPHMHYLGDSYKAWAELPNGDTIPLIDIPKWDFNWQRYYVFPHVQTLPAGSTLNAIGVFDNTINNPFNPSSPPINVVRGSKTEDEMLLCYFAYANYENGDENIFMGDTIPDSFSDPVGLLDIQAEIIDFQVFPNPTTRNIQAEISLTGNAYISITDATGRLIYSLVSADIQAQLSRGIEVAHFPKGTYFIQIQQAQKRYVGQFLKGG